MPRNGAIVNRLVGIDWLGGVALHQIVNLGEGAHALRNVIVPGGSYCAVAVQESGSEWSTRTINKGANKY